MSMSDPTSPLPCLVDYMLRWSGPALVVQTDGWRKKWLCDVQVEESQQQALKQVLRDLKPVALIIDLTDVPMLPAICSSVLAQLAKEMDAIKHPGRIAIIGATPSVLSYLQMIHFDRLFDLQPTEAAAVERLKKVLSTSEDVRDGSVS